MFKSLKSTLLGNILSSTYYTTIWKLVSGNKVPGSFPNNISCLKIGIREIHQRKSYFRGRMKCKQQGNWKNSLAKERLWSTDWMLTCPSKQLSKWQTSKIFNLHLTLLGKSNNCHLPRCKLPMEYLCWIPKRRKISHWIWRIIILSRILICL
jgi:hypothetical protein